MKVNFCQHNLVTKEETTLSHEGASIAIEEGTSDSCTKDCSSGTSASKIPTEVTILQDS